VIDAAEYMATKRSLTRLCLDHPAKVKATGRTDQRLVMAEARRRVAKTRERRVNPSPGPTRSLVTAQPRAREARARRSGGSSRASPARLGDDPDLPRCVYCGQPLVGKRPQARTCSNSHRVLLHRRRRREAAA
jgi:hypothetical protein